MNGLGRQESSSADGILQSRAMTVGFWLIKDNYPSCSAKRAARIAPRYQTQIAAMKSTLKGGS